MVAIPSPESSPEFAAETREQLELLLGKVGDATLQRVALLKLQGFLNDEIAKQLGVVPDTVGRKLRLIREKWVNLESDSNGT